MSKRLCVLFTARAAQWELYKAPLIEGFEDAGVPVDLITETSDPHTVDYIIYSPESPVQDFSPYTHLRAVFNLWAGVENIAGNATLKAPLCRMVDPGLTAGMVEWVIGHVMRYHLEMDRHIHGQDGVWRGLWAPPLASERTVAVLGLGALGRACAEKLAMLGFEVRGWSRSLKTIQGIKTFAGEDGFSGVLSGSDIIVLLTPLTADTENLMNADALSLVAPGARLINPGRGPLVDDTALLAALESGHICHATLDVFRTEPLPPEHPYWAHPNVTVTPHIASVTRPKTAALTIVDNIAGHMRGEALRHLVDRDAGY